jgi:hypothetical protein
MRNNHNRKTPSSPVLKKMVKILDVVVEVKDITAVWLVVFFFFVLQDCGMYCM